MVTLLRMATMQNLSTIDQIRPLFEHRLDYPTQGNSLLIEIKRGMAILTKDGRDVGQVKAVILDDSDRNVTHLLLSPGSQMLGHRPAPVNFSDQVDKEMPSSHIGSGTVDCSPNQHGERSSLVEPLTNRELEILRLIEAGLTNREIAAELIIATGTVKTHAHNIYGKLGVNRRTQAIARARDLKIL